MISPKKKRRLRVVAAVEHVYKAVDHWIQESQPEFEARSGKIQCKRGCNACCRMWITVTMPEALAIVTQYEDEVKEVRDKLECANELGTALTRKHFKNEGSLMSAEANATICSESGWTPGTAVRSSRTMVIAASTKRARSRVAHTLS